MRDIRIENISRYYSNIYLFIYLFNQYSVYSCLFMFIHVYSCSSLLCTFCFCRVYVSGISSCPVHLVFFSLNKSVQFSSVQSIFNHCDVIGQQSNRIRFKMQNKGYCVVQGHLRSSRLVSIESPYATSY